MEVVGTWVQGLRAAQLATTPGYSRRQTRGRRENRARPKDNDAEEAVGRRGDGESLQSCETTRTGDNAIFAEEKRKEEHDQKCASKGEKGGFTVPARVNSSISTLERPKWGQK